jgi:hypothetical protein
VALRWLFDNVPIAIWVIVVSLLFGAFMLGLAAEQCGPRRAWIATVEGLFKSPAPTHH